MKVKSQDRAQPAMEESVPVNLGTENEVKEVSKNGGNLNSRKNGTVLGPAKRVHRCDVFARSYDDMSEIDPEIAQNPDIPRC